MKLPTIVTLLTATAAFADPAPPSPDFVGRVPAHGVDRSFAASSGSSLIEPWDDIDFALDSALLVEAAQVQLERTADWMLAHPAYRLVVEGHTDSSGPWGYNLDLATRRADHARRFLVSRGAPTTGSWRSCTAPPMPSRARTCSIAA